MRAGAQRESQAKDRARGRALERQEGWGEADT